MAIVLVLCQAIALNCGCYRFDQGYCELWYTIPTADIFSLDELNPASEKISKVYRYRLVVYPANAADSAVHEGFKYATVDRSQKKDMVMDYIPIFLFPGVFSYRLEINSAGDRAAANGKIEIAADSISFCCSDLMLAKKSRTVSTFARTGVELIPLIDPVFNNSDTLFSYFETYGMVPDSLFYALGYIITDTAGTIIYTRDFKKIKSGEQLFDTLSVALDNFSAGVYKIRVSILDPVTKKSANLACHLNITERRLDLESMKYAFDIELLVGAAEYKRFCALPLADKKNYLKAFWQQHDYQRFEKKLMEADAKFSTSNCAGHRTNLGIYYILNGPPEEIEYRPMETGGSPAQVWHYTSRGLMVLFTDRNGDGNYELVGNLDFEDDFIRDIPIRWIKE